MKITDELIGYIGDLSRLHLSEEEKERAKKDLSDILDYTEKLNELDTDGVPANLVKDILLSIENLYKISTKEKLKKSRMNFYGYSAQKIFYNFARFHRQLDIIAEGYDAQSVSF